MHRALLPIGLTLSLTAAASAQESFTIDDLPKVKSAYGPKVSPDGGRVAYVLSVPRDVTAGDENGRARRQIRVATGEGENTLYASEATEASRVSWRDESSILYLADDENGDRALFQLAAGGGAPEAIFTREDGIGSYAVVGDTLFFTATDKRDERDEELREMGFDANVIDEDVRYSRLYRASLPDGEAERIGIEGHITQVVASPDGESLALAVADTPTVLDDIINRRIVIADAEAGKVRTTIGTEGKIGSFAFSPDGQRLGFLAGVDRRDPIAHTFGVADVRDGSFTFLTAEDEADEIDFVWTADREVGILAHQGTGSVLYSLDVESGETSNRTRQEGRVFTDIDGGANGIAAAGEAPEHPSEIFAGDALRRWTMHSSWLEDYDLAGQRVVTYEARDGIEVQGILIEPQGRKPRGGWPTIVVVHGGPEAHYPNGWLTRYSDPGQFGASEGYAVFYPNYRGSTGRGQAFAKLDHQDPPGAEFNDIVDGVRYLVEEGIAKEDAVGITGGSYGGYASAWGATAQTETFSAAVIFVALTDLISFTGSTDIDQEMIDSHFQIVPEDNWQTYLEQSPIYHAKGANTPALILHGEDDPRVNPAQSLELFRYLKRVGDAPTRLVTYPGEGHGNRRAAAQYDYALRMMRWFDTYLGDRDAQTPPRRLEAVDRLADE